MFIILSQRIDSISDYEDVPFNIYHYPKVYKNQISTGDYFLYYQGDSKNKQNRYYFGCGIVGEINEARDGGSFYAEILKGFHFPNKVPIYNPIGGYYESFGKNQENNINPAWQRSIRKISETAYDKILNVSGLNAFMIKELLNLHFQLSQNKKELTKLKSIMK